jgi:hypothetical protein
MDPRKPFSDHRVRERKLEEMAYEQALRELTAGEPRPGVMAKALAECGGDEAKARARYLELAVQSIRDDLYIAQRVAEPPAKPESKAYALYSLVVPGLGQLTQDRPLAAIGFCAGAVVLWAVYLGWLIHIWAAFDAQSFSERAADASDS